jgi:hypothetical protein
VVEEIFGTTVCKAATRYVRKHMGSLSPASSGSQATGSLQPAAHSLTRLVLPKPAGAEMRVVSGGGPVAASTNGHLKVGELIGKTIREAVIEALQKQDGLKLD